MVEKKKRRSWKFWALTLFCTVVVLAGVGAAGIVGWLRFEFSMAAAPLSGLLTEAKRRGLPLDPKDLAPANVRPNENAAPLYERAYLQAEKHKQALTLLKDLPSHPDGQSVQAARKAIADLGPAFATAERAVERPFCVFKHDWSKGDRVLFPEFVQLRSLSRMFSARAVVRAKEGDLSGSLEDVQRAMRCADDVSTTPNLIALLMEVSTRTHALRGFDAVLNARPSSPEFLLDAQRVLDASYKRPSYRRALEGEMVFARNSLYRSVKAPSLQEWLQARGKSSGEETESPVIPPLVPADLLRKGYDARMMALWLRVFDGFQDYANDPARLAALMEEVTDRAVADKDLTNALNAHTWPVFSGSNEAVVALSARRRLLDTKLDLLLYRARNGKFPAKLTGLGTLPRDPFGGRGLRYRKQGDGFVLYSVGPDLKDNKGRFRGNGFDDSEGYDLVVKHPMVMKARPSGLRAKA
jgi:hypothetical protein